MKGLPVATDAVARIGERIAVPGANGLRAGGGVVVVLTGHRRRDGVTTMAIALARYFAATPSRRVLLIDASENGGSIPWQWDHTAPDVTLSPIESLIQAAQGGGDGHRVALLRWPGDPGGAPADLVAESRQRYDVVLVDAGPLTGAGFRRWSRCADQTVLVVDGNRTTVEALRRLATELDHAQVQLTGVILNRRRFWIPDFLYRFLY